MNNHKTIGDNQQKVSQKFDKDITKLALKLSVASGLGAGATFLHHRSTGGIFIKADSLMFTTFVFTFVLATAFALFFLFTNFPLIWKRMMEKKEDK